MSKSDTQQLGDVAHTTTELSSHKQLMLVQDEVFKTLQVPEQLASQIVRWDSEGNLSEIKTNIESVEAVFIIGHGKDLKLKYQTPIELLGEVAKAGGEFGSLKFIVLLACEAVGKDFFEDLCRRYPKVVVVGCKGTNHFDKKQGVNVNVINGRVQLRSHTEGAWVARKGESECDLQDEMRKLVRDHNITINLGIDKKNKEQRTKLETTKDEGRRTNSWYHLLLLNQLRALSMIVMTAAFTNFIWASIAATKNEEQRT